MTVNEQFHFWRIPQSLIDKYGSITGSFYSTTAHGTTLVNKHAHTYTVSPYFTLSDIYGRNTLYGFGKFGSIQHTASHRAVYVLVFLTMATYNFGYCWSITFNSGK